MLTRRELLKVGALAGTAAVVPVDRAGVAPARRSAPVFDVPLTIPPELRPRFSAGNTDFYEVTIREAAQEILPGTQTPIWGFGGVFPGPTIRTRPHRRVVVKQTNTLPEETVVHLHGANVPASSDGYPTDLIEPGESRYYIYPNHQRAAALWYHDHTHMKEARHTYNGLAGLYLIEGPNERRLDLPSGPYEVPLIIQDRLFNDDGSFKWPDNDEHADVILVNGRPHPFFEVEQRTYRFRVLNGSSLNGLLNLRLADHAPFQVIGTDGGLLPAPVEMRDLSLWPAERLDLVFDFSAYPLGSHVVLENTRTDMGLPTQVMRFDVTRKASTAGSPLPSRLAPVRQLRESDATTTREFVMAFDPNTFEMTINGKVFDPNRIDIRPRLGDTEIWHVINADEGVMANPHSFHTHLVQFQILDRDGVPPSPAEAGWKDTVSIEPGRSARIIAKFGHYRGLYPYHCHIQWHSDMGMMAQMEVH